MENLLLTRKQSAEMLNISVDTLDRLRAKGEIDCLRIGSNIYFSPDELRAFVSKKGVVKTI